jgi:hypothetical protein
LNIVIWLLVLGATVVVVEGWARSVRRSQFRLSSFLAWTAMASAAMVDIARRGSIFVWLRGFGLLPLASLIKAPPGHIWLPLVLTLIGFGCLATGSLLGVRSLGYVMFLGCVSILLASLIILPAVLAWREWVRGERPSNE